MRNVDLKSRLAEVGYRDGDVISRPVPAVFVWLLRLFAAFALCSLGLEALRSSPNWESEIPMLVLVLVIFVGFVEYAAWRARRPAYAVFHVDGVDVRTPNGTERVGWDAFEAGTLSMRGFVMETSVVIPSGRRIVLLIPRVRVSYWSV